MKFASYRRTTRGDNADQTHNYSSELSSGDLIGAVFMSFSTRFAEVDAGDSSEFRAAWSIGQIFQADSSTNATLGVFRNISSSRQGRIRINSEGNVGYVTTQRNNTTDQNFITINSIDHPNAAINVSQSAFGTSVSYHHTFWTGNSLDVEVNRSATINVLSTDLTFAHSTNISPDLAFVFINDAEIDDTGGGLAHVQWGVIDMRNINDRFFFNVGQSTGGAATILPSVNRLYSQGNSFPRFTIEPSSAAHGLNWTVRSTGGISDRLADTTAVAAAFVKVDSGYAAKAKYFRAPGTYDATGTVRSVQTNSIYLEFVQIMGTDQSSIDAYVSASYGGYGQGVWTISHGNAPIALGMSMNPSDEAQHTHDASSFGLRVRFGNSSPNGFRYHAHSLVTGSGAFSFTEFVGSYGLNAYQFWVGVGKPIDAPSHLMDANSKSIFLSDDSDYNDNLLLVAAAGAPPAPSDPFEYQSGWNTIAASAGSWKETWADISSRPELHISLVPVYSTGSIGAENTDNSNFSINFTTITSDTGSTAFTVGLAQALEGTAEDRDARHIGQNAQNMTLIDNVTAATDTLIWRTASAGVGEISWTHYTGQPQTNSIAYYAVTLAGSFQHAGIIGQDTTGTDVGSWWVASVPFQPDIVINITNTINTNTTGYNAGNVGNHIGWQDLRASLDSEDIYCLCGGFTTTGPEGGWIMRDGFFGDHGIKTGDGLSRPGYRVRSYGGGALHFQVTTKDSFNYAHRAHLFALKAEGNTAFRTGRLNAGDSVATQSIQTNSFLPNWLFMMATQYSSISVDASIAANSVADGASIGMWTRGNAPGCVGFSQAGVSATGQAYTKASSDVLYVPNGYGSACYRAYSLSAASGGFSLTFAASTNYPNGQVAFLSMGQAVNAPAHLAGAGGESIFLADNSDYSDNLLLSNLDAGSVDPGSGGGGSVDLTGGALFRSNPITDNRKFPTPLTNVRAFPSD